MKPLRVVNLHRQATCDTYIGRSKEIRDLLDFARAIPGTKGYFGNPYSHLAAPGIPFEQRTRTREEAIEKFRRYAEDRIEWDRDYRQAIRDLEGDLGCFCAPAACHGDVLIELRKRIREEDEREEFNSDYVDMADAGYGGY